MTTFTPTRPVPAAAALACGEYSPYSGTNRPAATISVEHATRLLDAFGHDPVDVAGL